ncbi:unannotated protein [freshwater metagenome]|uniref:Unannotated protein n=1 Tax=freshwater metagenome TaxID=449393 RepID=A0A6J7MXR9_9ZZZZ
MKFVECESNQIIGRKTIAKTSIIGAAASAIASVLKRAKRLGTSSPKTNEKYAIIKVKPIKDKVLLHPRVKPRLSNHGST